MAAISDLLLVIAMLCYLMALVAHAASHALTDRTRLRAPALAAAVVAGPAGDTPPPPRAEPAPDPRRRAWATTVGLWATALAAVTQAGCLLTRGLAAERVPWGNMYEFIIALTLAAVTAWLVTAVRTPAWRPLGLYVCVVTLLLLGFAGLRVYTPAGPLVPALDSVWLKIHVSTAALASGVFLVGFVAAVGYLIRTRSQSTPDGFAATLAAWLPAGPVLERVMFRLHAFAFPIWTFAVIAGAIWAEASWGRYWGWDPKETWAFISWVVYAGYLHARATPSVRRSTTAWLAVVGWLTMMFNLFAVNLLISGLHSYAGA